MLDELPLCYPFEKLTSHVTIQYAYTELSIEAEDVMGKDNQRRWLMVSELVSELFRMANGVIIFVLYV